MGITIDLARLTLGLAWAFFLLTFSALLLTLAVMIGMRPRTRSEWAATSLIASFLAVVAQRLVLVVNGWLMLPQPWGALFWLVNAALVGFYVADLVDNWLGIFSSRRNRMYIGGGLLLLIVVVLLIVLVF